MDMPIRGILDILEKAKLNCHTLESLCQAVSIDAFSLGSQLNEFV